jgi:hypothetical protein
LAVKQEGEVVSGCGQDGVDGIALAVRQVIAAETVFAYASGDLDQVFPQTGRSRAPTGGKRTLSSDLGLEVVKREEVL